MDEFRFKQFVVSQCRAAMKVGTDGVLIGAWAGSSGVPQRQPLRVLDIGTGTGLIALMVAQRMPQAEIVGIDIDEMAVDEARENVASSPWKERISIRRQALQEVGDEVFDVIVSNPPFFINSMKSPDSQRSVARHTDSLSMEDLIRYSCRLLSDEDGAHASFILPLEATTEVQRFASIYGLFLQRRVGVHTLPSKNVKRVLLEFGKIPSNNIMECEEIMYLNAGQKSEWYHRLTEDFYLDAY